MKTGILYGSSTGTTQELADKIRKVFNDADLFDVGTLI